MYMSVVCVCLCTHAHECVVFMYDVCGAHKSTEPRTRPHLTRSKGKTASLLITFQWLPLELNLTPHQGPRDLTSSEPQSASPHALTHSVPATVVSGLLLGHHNSFLLNNLHCYSLCPAQLTANSTWLGSMGL